MEVLFDTLLFTQDSESVLFYAVAGLYNLSNDASFAVMATQKAGVLAKLHSLADSPNPDTVKCAALAALRAGGATGRGVVCAPMPARGLAWNTTPLPRAPPACRDVASLMPAHLPASPLISTLGAWQVCVRDRRQLAQASQRLLAAAVDAALLTTARGL